MVVTKYRPGAGSGNRRNRMIEDTASRMEGHVSLRPFAEHSRGRGEAARVELKRSLRASEEALQRLIEASLLGVLLVTKEHKPLLVNQTCARMFGFESPAQIVALGSIAGPIAPPRLTLIEITGHEKAGTAPSEREAQLGAIMGHAPAETYLKDRDGRYPRINRRYQDLWGVKDEEVRGRLPGLGAIAADVAERKRAEARRTISLCQDGGQRAR